MHTQSSSEYWNRSGSLVHTDPLGKIDAEIPENVRLYFFGGTQHGPSGFTTEIGDGQTAPNPADYRPFLRTLLLALDRWAKEGIQPPPSVYPTISDGTLVPWTQIATGFPDIPGIRYPGVIQQPSFLDFGSRWQDQRIIDNQPPIPRGNYHVLVPRSGPDGNELGCLSPPEVAIPIGTYTSWRLYREDGPAANQLYSLSGSYIPFPVTQAERERTGDPRQSLEERYGTAETYLGQLEAQCQTYEAAGYLLKEDTERTLQIQRERVTPLFSSHYDVVIYGGTSAGIAAAVQVKRMGGSVVVIEPGRRIGGLTTGGLGQTDIGNKAAIGGIAREFYERVRRYYDQPENWKCQRREEYRDGGQTQTGSKEEAMWTFEPSAALAIMQDLVREYDIPVIYEQRLDRTSLSKSNARVRGVTLDGRRIVAISTESGQTWRGQMFLDATYEGDLMAEAGISYTVGRESNEVYGETLNGVQTQHAKYHQFMPGVDPYVVPGNASSGLLPGVDANGPGTEGSGDHRVQAFCFRMCLTDHPENRIPFVKPDGYDPLVYELLLRNFEAGEKGMPWINSSMPNRKTDTNNRTAFSTDFIGYNYDYPEATYAEREAISQRHREYQQGLMWTLANHPRVPDPIRNEVARWGTCRDEFEREDGWQQQLYVREARRLVGAVVMTQHHCQGREITQDAIGLAAYTMDSHNVQRYVDPNGHVRNEGDVEVGGFQPYGIS
ncbi:MAG: FAD-dependent oxidoreductase, partial [Planctomycetaceae bacterium]|nr:FAD-dependent oxidoreductase [Planctomycetaceae bacterium]